MTFPILANLHFSNPWILALKQDDPWNLVIGVAALVILWRSINRAMDKDLFDE